VVAEVSENKVWYLKKSRLFSDATDNVVRECEHLFTQVNFGRRHVIFEQGEPGRLVYLVKSGSVRIARTTADGGDLTVAMLGPNDLFGEEVTFHDVVRSTFATCIEDSLLCVANGRDLFGLITRHASLAINVARYLGEQRDQALSIAEDLAFLKVPERLVRLLEKLAVEHGSETDDGTRIDLALTHADIASLVGSTRETVSLHMKKLETDGRIRIASRRIVVRGRRERVAVERGQA
jgi:CRP/FNR family cyclic AMP-dependent transcriptional regulator